MTVLSSGQIKFSICLKVDVKNSRKVIMGINNDTWDYSQLFLQLSSFSTSENDDFSLAATEKGKWKHICHRKEEENLFDAGGMLDNESLSISLYAKPFSCSKVSPVQLTGTRTAKARKVMGTNIFKLHICFAKFIILPQCEM